MTAADVTRAPAPRGERRLAALLYADLSGYTRLCRTLDPEDVAATVLPLLAELRAAVMAERGIVTGMAGDGFLAVFGVPVSATDIADHAARAALEMRRIVHARSSESSALQIPDIHIGLTAGEVLAFVSDDPSGWSFIGPAVNLAARLSDAAPAGTILVDEQFRRLMVTTLAVGAPSELVLQGHEDGVRVWELMPAATLAAAPPDPPFVGREDLLSRLDRLWPMSHLWEMPRLVRLVGEAGIGKTTLVRRWLERRPDAAAVWVNCLDAPFGDQVDELLRRLQELTGVPPAPSRPVTSLMPGVLPIRPDEDVSVRARDVLRLLHHVPGKGIALVLDDYQHADDELRGVVDALCSSRTPIPVVVVCPCRTDDLHAASSADDCVVPPLDDDAVTTLVCAALGAPPPQPVVDALLSRAEGRPLAALQSSAYLVETGTVAIEDDRCVVVHPQRLSDLPDSMRLFVAGRLDRLPPSDKQLLQELSAVGTSVDLDVVTRLFGADAAQLATGLVARGFLVHEGDRLRFSHGVVHEVAYAALPRSVRARLHRRIVEEDPIGDVAVRAAHARRWLATASEASPDERQHAAAAALHHTRVHAQQLYTEHVRNAYAEARTVRGLLEDDSDVAPADAASLLVLLASCDINAGRYDDALAGAVRAVDLCRHHEVDPSLLVAALCTRGEALSMLRHYQSARQALDEALHIAGAHDDHVGRGRALRLLGDTYRHSDSNRLLALTEEAYDVLSACGDEHGAAEAARSMAYWLSVSTAPRLARWLDEAERRTPARDVRGRLELARTAAFAAGARLDAAVAREHARTCRALGVELGIGDAIVDGLMSGIESAAALGLLDESIALLDELEDYARSRAEPRVRQMAAVVGLQPLQRTGQTARARDARAQAVALRDAFGPPETMMAAAALGLAARDRGAWSEALDHLQLAVEAGDAAGFSLSALVLRHEIVLTSAFVGVVALDAVEVAEHAEAGGAPIIAASIRAALGLAAARPPDAGDTWTLQEEAVRADAVALHLESRDDDASGAWADSIAAWRPLGHTVFLARALARSGAREDAEHTLDLVEATAEGRAWALQR